MDMEFIKETLAALKREFSRFRAVCALVFAVVMIGVIGAGMFWPKSYESNALVYIDSANIIEPLLNDRARVSDIDRAEQAEKLLYTRSLLRAAAEQTGLLTPDSTPEDVDRVITSLRNKLMVEAEGESFFRVTFWNKNPDRSYEVLNALLQTFIGNRSGARHDESSNAYTFINSQVTEYKKQLDEAERKLQAHKAASPGVSEADVKQRISEITNEIQNLRIAIQQTESQIATTKQLLNEEDQYLSARSESGALKQRRRALQEELAQLRLSYRESYPDIISIKGQLQDIDATLQAMGAGEGYQPATGEGGGALFEDLRSQLSVAEVNLRSQSKRLQSLKELLADERQRADAAATAEARLAELQRDYNVIVQVYEKLLARQETAKMTVALNTSGGNGNYDIIEEPVYPLEPGGPQFIHFAVAAPVLGLGAPIGLLLALIMADPRIRSTSRLMESAPPELELMAVVPHFESPAEKRRARAEIAMLAIFCTIAIVAYGMLVYAGFTGLV